MSRESRCSGRNLRASPPSFRPLEELERSICETRPIYHEGRDLRGVLVYQDKPPWFEYIYHGRVLLFNVSSSNFYIHSLYQYTLFPSSRLQVTLYIKHYYTLFSTKTTQSTFSTTQTHNAFPTSRSSCTGCYRRGRCHFQQA
jgi:hypothetical protein